VNYSDLVTRIEDIVEDDFTTDQVNHFIQQAEQKIYHTVHFPDMRKNTTGACTINDPYVQTPSDFLWILSFAVIDGSGNQHYLLNKDVNFIREAYPDSTATGLPKYYGVFTDEYFLIGPTPDASYSMQLHYGYEPESIVTATNTWLGDNFDSALLNGALVEAARFMKEEEDVVALYEKMYQHAIMLLKNTADGKMRQDFYRSGQVKVPVA
jgi:hypothetical protein